MIDIEVYSPSEKLPETGETILFKPVDEYSFFFGYFDGHTWITRATTYMARMFFTPYIQYWGYIPDDLIETPSELPPASAHTPADFPDQ